MKEAESRKYFSKEEYINSLLGDSEIGLWIEGYDDIFSDFDARHYSQRSLSQDFLEETKRASRDKKKGNVRLKFMMASKKRELEKEKVIEHRLKNHFIKHYEILNKEKMSIIKNGIYFVIIGFILMVIATIVLYYNYNNIVYQLLIMLIEPASWFLFWEGGELILFSSKQNKEDLNFYDKMKNIEIEFWSA